MLKEAHFWQNFGYRIICKNCQKSNKVSSYEGETGRPARVRLNEHLAGLKNKTKANALYKHQLSAHPEENPDWEVKITGTFKSALSRQADEAVRIANLNPSSLINCKSEFNHPPINRVKVHRQSLQKWFHFVTYHEIGFNLYIVISLNPKFDKGTCSQKRYSKYMLSKFHAF